MATIMNNNTGLGMAAATASENVSAETVKNEEKFTEEELRRIEEYAAKIDITDSTSAICYGSDAQKKIADFSDTALAGARVKDLGETGDMIADLMVELSGIGEEEKGGFLGLFKKTKNKIEAMKQKYTKAEKSVDGMVEVLEGHQITLMKDISVLDNLYEMNLGYMKELALYIAAGKKKLAHEREVTLAELQKKAAESGLPEDAQAASDFAEMCNRFERRIHDLELTRTISVQTAPQIRLLQNNDAVMTEKIQTVIMNTVPLWKSQMVIALGIAHSKDAMEAQRAVTDMTNELLKKNAEALKGATVDIAREAERGVVDIETLTATNEALISTLDEVRQIQTDAKARRAEAEAELVRIEAELKRKLLEASGAPDSEQA
ncbi:MAG: toxic anion resistance protein [Clostridia bacterium]|nr:toxic anion resistance protein [Clostridia bacterium]